MSSTRHRNLRLATITAASSLGLSGLVTIATPALAAGVPGISLFSPTSTVVSSPDGQFATTIDGPTALTWHDVTTGASRVIGTDSAGVNVFPGNLRQYYIPGYSPGLDRAVQFTQSEFPLDVVYTEDVATGTITQVPLSLTQEIAAEMPDFCRQTQHTLPSPIKQAGRDVLLTTYCPITDDDEGDRSDTYLYNRDTRHFTLVSVPLATPHDSLTFNYGGDISGDGRRVVYDVSAPIPYPPSTVQTRQLDVIVWDRDTDTRRNISSGPNTTTFGQSFGESISADGHAVVFQSYRDEIPGTDTGSYVWTDDLGLRGFPPLPGQSPVPVTAGPFTPDGRHLTYSDPNGGINLYDTNSGQARNLLPPRTDGQPGITVVRGITDNTATVLFYSNRADLVPSPPQYGGTYRLMSDTTPPVVTATADRPPNAAGWYDAPVTISFSCMDASSGIATCPQPVTVTSDGANQTITGTTTDNAGNTASAATVVNLDQHGPTISAQVSQPANANGWNNGDVTVTFTCSDAVSGVAICPQPSTLTDDGPNQVVTGTALDLAGNSVTAQVTVSIDKTKPLITAVRTATNGNGWNNTAVTVTFSCADADSGIASCTPPITLTGDGAGQTATGTAINRAGLTDSATVTGINIDRTAPAVNVVGANSGATYALDQAPTPSCATTDVTSGVATQAHLSTSRNADGVITAICSGAIDIAGNPAAPVAISYTVVPTAASLSGLTSQYVSGSGAPNADGVIHDLENKLLHGQICQYIAKVNDAAAAPKPSLTTTQAAELIYWARILNPNC